MYSFCRAMCRTTILCAMIKMEFSFLSSLFKRVFLLFLKMLCHLWTWSFKRNGLEVSRFNCLSLTKANMSKQCIGNCFPLWRAYLWLQRLWCLPLKPQSWPCESLQKHKSHLGLPPGNDKNVNCSFAFSGCSW